MQVESCGWYVGGAKGEEFGAGVAKCFVLVAQPAVVFVVSAFYMAERMVVMDPSEMVLCLGS